MTDKVKSKRKPGRPTLYNEQIANEICEKIATCSTGIKALCKQISHWPDPDTVYMWLNRHKEFADQYAHAKEKQIELLVDEIIEISDNMTNDTNIKVNKAGDTFKTCNSEWVNRSRLRVDARFRLAELLKPKKYSSRFIDKSSAENLVKSIIEKL